MEQPFTHSGTRDPAPSPREQENAALARQAAAAGIVLLKNRGVLPLNPGAPVALFGAGAGRTVKGGTGSGDVNNRASVSIWQGLKEAGVPLTSEDWLADCEARYTRAREDWRAQVLAAAKQVDNPFDAYAARPFALPEGRTIRPQDLKGAKAALYVISRIAGEGKDRRLEPGDYYLSDAERADLQTLDESGLPVVLLLSAPQGELPRERRRLAGFAKTRRLAPGETQTLTLEIPQKQLAAFHPEQNAWVVDAGLYGVWVGNSSDALRLCALLEVDAAVTLERTHPICPPQHPIGELGAAPGAQDREADQWRQKVEYDLPVYKFVPVAPAAPAPAAPLLAEGDLDSLVPLLYGNITAGASTLGSAGIRVPGSAGETSEALEASRQIPSLIMADGPAGLRLRQCYQADRATGEVYGAGVLGSLENSFLEAPPRHESADTYYQFCTAFPVGTALAQSWDPDLLAQVGRAVSREMDEFHVDLWLAPGMNIQRNPLCGRNFEYYSEDPLLTGTLAAAITAGVQESGRHGVTLKHFACNNQEDNRMAVDARVSERALREIYLRGFEIAVKAAAPAAVMSAYNCINGVHAANSRDLCTVVLRQEWGFAGLVMSDWNTTVPQDGSTPWRCAWAGNDVIMPGNPHDDADIRAALADGRLPETAARQSAARLIALASALRGG